MPDERFLPIDAEDAKLIAAAQDVLRRNYRAGRHTVGAAVLCESGKIYTGIDVEACGYGPCAEPIAIGAAFSNGEREIRKIVAVRKTGAEYPVLSPCGNCRQLVFDYSPDAIVIFNLDGQVRKTAVRNLLPGAYASGFDED
ncbi:MAG TPA: cytidine deaminase [Phycisphaerae bacterium]|nr:cytidine deaminase [Phycisphaerae bacterium]